MRTYSAARMGTDCGGNAGARAMAELLHEPVTMIEAAPPRRGGNPH
jgi:hypothetical protein